MRKDRALLIINPISGGIDKQDIERKVARRLSEMGIDNDTRYTTAGGQAESFAFDAIAQGYTMVVAIGGDGTINEVASALRNSGVALAIIPCGSGNGLARHIGLTPDVDKAIDIIAARHIIEADCGVANGVPFFCTFGLGFDAAVSETFATSGKRGPISYLRSAMKEFIKYEPASYEISFDGEHRRFSAFILTICNASQYGNNAFIAPQASIKDGYLDVTVIHKGNPIVLATAGVDLFTGRIDHNMFIQSFRIKEATITTEATVMHVDGEPITMQSPVRVSCEHKALRIFTNPDKKPFKPILTPISYMSRDVLFHLSKPFKKK